MRSHCPSVLLLLAGVIPSFASILPGGLVSSPDGTCGGSTGHSCKLSFYGGCCGANDKCGSTTDACGPGCQSEFGYCSKVKRSLQCPTANNSKFTASNGDVYTIECGVDHAGGDISSGFSYTDSLDACINTCSQTTGCVDVSWVPGSTNGPCYLKSVLQPASSNSQVWGAKLVPKTFASSSISSKPGFTSSISLSKTSSAPSSSSSTKSKSSDDNSSSTSKVKSSDDAQSATTKVKSSDDTQTSSAKSSSVSKTVSTSPTSSPVVLCPGLNGTTYTDGCGATYTIECGIDHCDGDMPGGPITTGSLNECIGLCSTTQGCVDVSWVSGGSTGPCYLKSTLGDAKSNSAVWGGKQLSGCAVSSSSSSQITASVSSRAGSSSTTSSSSAQTSSSTSAASVTVSTSAISSSASTTKTTTTSATSSSSSGSTSAASVSTSTTKSSVSSSASSSSVSVSSSSSTATVTSRSSSSAASSSKSTALNSTVSTTSTSTGQTSLSIVNATTSAVSISSSSSKANTTSSNSNASLSLSSTVVDAVTPSSALSSSSSGNVTSSSVSITSSSTLSTITTSPSLVPSNSLNVTSSTTANTTSSSSATCSTAPTPTAGMIPGCIPCEGQPGTDKFCGYDINTDYYKFMPKTCKVVTYEFDITNTTLAPDGVEREVLIVNGQMPGPPIKASWGDTVVVKVNNLMQNNGTSIHFHGQRQWNNTEYDGVVSITQCPIAPGNSMTYIWYADSYGTSWYHSHFGIQTWEGVLGPVVIDGPSSAEFDVDLGPIMIMDWSHFTVDSRYDLAENATLIPNRTDGATYGGPVLLDTGLLNGKNIWLGDDQDSAPIGERLQLTFEPGKKHLLRIVNGAIQSTYKFFLDGHTMTVISMDYTPIKPYKTDILNINIGQRYNVIIEANQVPSTYFLRADNQNACAGTVQAKDIRAIVTYSNAPQSGVIPTSTAYNYTEECVDEPYASLVPIVPLNAGAADFTEGTLDVVVKGNDVQLFKWYLSGTTFFSQYGDPTLLDIYKNDTVPDYSGALLVKLPTPQQMIYVIIESAIPLPHPIHLHGHDFWVLAQGEGTYDSSVLLNLNNPPRRDTALMPGAGYLVVAFVTDNPGVWLMHCHIGWHTSMGFALQFVERQDEIKPSGGLRDSCSLTRTCDAWNIYAAANNIVVEDSGV